MSETLQETQDTPDVEPETPNVGTAGADLSALTDARIEDEQGFRTTLASLLDAAKKAVAAQNRYDNATSKLAEARAMIRAYFIKPDGLPDWAASSDAYSVAVQNAEAAVMVNLGAAKKNSLNAAVRQQVRRKYLLPTIVNYIIAHTPNLKGDEVAMWCDTTKTDEDGTTVPLTPKELDERRSKVLADPSDKLKREVRRHYRARDLAVPPGWDDVVTPEDPGDAGTTPPNALSALSQAVEGAKEQVIPRYAALEALHLVSLVSARLVDSRLKEIEGRVETMAVLDRIAAIATTTAAMINTDMSVKVTDEEQAAMVAAYFDSEADKVKS